MKYLWLLLILPAVIAQASFGDSYLKKTRTCRKWSCVNTKLGFPDTLPPRTVAGDTFKSMIPQGEFHDVIDKALDNCYGNRSRRYNNACPGEALLHCFVDQMIENCPADSVPKDFECSRVSTLDTQIGINTMFSQSIYYVGKSLTTEKTPHSYITQPFRGKCCNLPTLFSPSIMGQCGLYGMMVKPILYNSVMPAYTKNFANIPSTTTSKAIEDNPNVLKVVELNQIPTQPKSNILELKSSSDINVDPLDCCDIKGFIQPSWRSECDFHLNWKGNQRLVIEDIFRTTTAVPVTTTTVSSNAVKDVMLLPHSCKQESCLFKNLDIVDDAGNVNIKAYMNMLTNFTDVHPIWTKAAGRVITKCLTKNTRQYTYNYDCQINKILACTLDLLTENCPYKRDLNNTCRHDKTKRGCQISSSKYLKNRREVCMLPPLIDQNHLAKCDLDAVYKVEHVLVPKPPKHTWAQYHYKCEEHKPSTSCIISRMGVMNKYNFMDYFKMKDKIRQFAVGQPEWSALLDMFMSTYLNMPMYRDHCTSEKRMLNVLDAMIMTCPVSKRVNTTQCNKFFNDITDTPAMKTGPRQKLNEIMKHYQHIFLPTLPHHSKFSRVIRKHSKTSKKPLYNYGLLESRDLPKVQTISIKPAVITRLDKPLVLAPVYMRNPNLSLATPFHNDHILRSNPYWLHDRVAEARTPAPQSMAVPRPTLRFFTSAPRVVYDETDPNANIPIDESSRMLKPE